MVASTDHQAKVNVQVKPSPSLTQVFKLSLDRSFPSQLVSSPLLLVTLVLVTTISSPWMPVVVLLLTDSTTCGIFLPLLCIWLINSILVVRSKCTSTWHILMSVDVTTMLPRFHPEVLQTNNSLKKLQSISHHAMRLVWFLITAPTKMEQSIKPSIANERLAHEWESIFPVSFRNLFANLMTNVLKSAFSEKLEVAKIKE